MSFWFILFVVISFWAAVLTLAFMAGIIKLHTQNEGTATAWQGAGRYRCTTMEYGEHHFDADGFIVDGPGKNVSGIYWVMLRFWGWIFYITGLVKPSRYLDYNNDDGFGTGDSVFLHEKLIQKTLKKEETKEALIGGGPIGAIAPDVTVIFRVRVVNVYKFLFVAPKDVIGQTMLVMEGIMRTFIRNHSSNELLAMDSKTIWEEINAPDCSSCKDIKGKRDDWGVEIIPFSVSILSVGFSEAYQEALEAGSVQELGAQGTSAQLFNPLKAAKDMGINEKDAAALMKLHEGGTVVDFDFHSAGRSIDPTTVMFGGQSVAGIVAAGNKPNRGKDQQSKGGQPGQQKKSGAEEAAEKYFAENGEWPPWDPLNRGE